MYIFILNKSNQKNKNTLAEKFTKWHVPGEANDSNYAIVGSAIALGISMCRA